jgi:hypothetical protein
MLEVPSSTTATAAREAVTSIGIDGQALRRALHGRPPAWRAKLAAEMVRGTVVVGLLSPAQAARLCATNPGSVSVALGNRGRRGPRDRTIDRLIRRFGVEPLMRGLDRATAPQRVAAE